MLRISLVLAACLALAAFAPAQNWQVPGDFPTIQDAIDDPAVMDGDTIRVGPGSFAGALVTKGVEIRGVGGAVIDFGPVHGSGFVQGFRLLAGSDGATLSHLTFTTDLSIMNADAVNGVTVEHCTFLNSLQAISNWRGSDWLISHNTITDLFTSCGGGIGILIADFAGGVVTGNVVEHNKITGTLNVDPNDCGGYSGTGIVLYADFRWGGAGTMQISDNYVVHNKVSLVSDTPAVVDVVAFELTESRNDPMPVYTLPLWDNRIGFNDWRGTELQMSITPPELEDQNSISRNKGKNRGHGLHPGLFKPN